MMPLPPEECRLVDEPEQNLADAPGPGRWPDRRRAESAKVAGIVVVPAGSVQIILGAVIGLAAIGAFGLLLVGAGSLCALRARHDTGPRNYARG
jgi:hypothetical protein